MAREQRHTWRSPRGRRGGRRRQGWLVELLVLSLLAFAVVSYHYDLGERWFGWGPVDPVAEPDRVLPPEGLRLPAPREAPAVAEAAGSVEVDAAAVAAAVRPELRGRVLGPRYSVLVADAATGEEVFREGAQRVIPASTTKLLTAVAALESLGPQTELTTDVRWLPAQRRLVLVGGGDPFLERTPADGAGLYPERADLTTLAGRTATALREAGVEPRGLRLSFDDSLFTGPAVNPTWPDTYLADITSGISALWVGQAVDDDGFGFVADPGAQAARAFADALRGEGVRVRGAVERTAAPAGGEPLAEVSSASVAALVERMLATSDNQAADVLQHHVGLAEQGEGSFLAGAESTLQVLRRLGVPAAGDVLYDGSGLSRENLVSAATLTATLRLADDPDRPELRATITGLPVAGFSGSLADRFDNGPADALGRVRAKTGTLTGVHGLAGVAQDATGARLAFVVVADRVRPARELEARLQVDRVAAALGACGCGVGS
jgi:D-alanyl-D-alanine carboxypeptidase/D-alanyl-D-alanine-endopeptidase (penicillin-binding protein 4)